MKKRYITIGVSVLLVILLVVGVWIFPLIQAACILHKVPDFNSFEYEVSINLKEDNLSDQQRQFMSIMSWLLNTDESDCLKWKAAGTFQGGAVYAKIYVEGLGEPVTELYYREEESAINIKMLYDTLRESVMSSHPLLGGVLPEWGYGTYISLEQIEEIFQVNLKEMFQIEYPAENQKPTLWESVLMLAGMDRKKGDNGALQFETSFQTYQVLLELSEKEEIPVLEISGSDTEENQKIAGYEGRITFDNSGTINFPKSLMADEDIEEFSRLWSTLSGMKEAWDRGWNGTHDL